MKSELGEPIQRVALSAILLGESISFMRGSIPLTCYTVIMKLVGNVHLVEGKSADIPQVLSMLEGEGITISANPDLHVRHHRHFGIDEARDLSARAALKALEGVRRVFVLAVDSITAEAQNALLKTLEDAPGNALFIFLHPAPQTLLPTVRSRAQMLALPPNVQGRSLNSALEFLKANPAKRLDMLKPFLDKNEDDRRDMGTTLQFLSALECSLAPLTTDGSARAGIVAIYRARKYIGDRGALAKPLLEQVALLVPVI